MVWKNVEDLPETDLQGYLEGLEDPDGVTEIFDLNGEQEGNKWQE